VIDGIALQDPGVRAQSQASISSGQPTAVTLKMPPAPNTTGVIITQSGTPAKFELPPQGILQKGYQSVLWSAHDDNEDELRYTLYYRGENEQDWKLLKNNLDQKFYSWDSTTLPDGAYYLKIVATDAPSNPPSQALNAVRESERFEIDNTPPLIENLRASVSSPRSASAKGPLESNTIIVEFTARDAATSVDRAQYSLDGGEWTPVVPESTLSGAPQENYKFSLETGPGAEHTIAVRAFDRFENIGSAKTTITVPSAKL
jgi:hypothetical protein